MVKHNNGNGGENVAESVTLGSLLYYIKCKNEEFKRGMREIEDKLENVNKKAQDNAKKMKTWGLAITGISVGVVTALQLMTKSTAEGVEQLEKYSIATGMSTQELQKWGYAAKLNKSSLDQLAQGLTFLARSMRSADLESQAAQEAFNELGIEIKDKQGNFRNMGDILDDIRERLFKMANGAEKTALVTKLFGRGAADLVPVLSLSREELDQLGQEAERLGIILTKDNIAQFAKYKDSLEAVEEGMSGLKMQIAAAVLPAMQDMISMVKNAIIWFNKLPEPIKKAIPQLALMAATIGMIVGPIMLVVGAWGKLKAAIMGMQIVAAIQGIVTGATTGVAAVSALASAFTPLLIGGAVIAGIIVITNALNKMEQQAKYSAKAIADIATIDEARNALETWRTEYVRLSQQLEKTHDFERRQGGEAAVGQSAGSKSLEAKLQTAKENYDAAADRLRKLTENAAKNQTTTGASNNFNISRYLTELKEKLDAVDKTAKAFGDTTNVAADKADILKNAIVELIDNGISPEDARIQKLVVQYKKYSGEADSLTKAIENQKNATNLLEQAQQRLNELTGNIIPEWQSFANQLREAAKANGVLDQTKEKLLAMADAIEKAGGAADKDAKQDRIMEFKYEQGEISSKEYRDYLEERLKAYKEYSDEWMIITRKINDIDKSSTDQMKKNQADLVADLVLRKTTIEDVWKQMCDEILRNWILTMFGVKTEAGATTKTLDGLFGNIFSGVGNFFGNIFKGIGNFLGFFGGGGGSGLGSTDLPGIPANLASRGMIVPAASNGMILPPSFGTDTVLSALTPKEMVLPVDISEGLQQMIRQGSQPQVVNNNITNNYIDAIDQQSVAQFFYKNRDYVVGIVQDNQRRGGVLRPSEE